MSCENCVHFVVCEAFEKGVGIKKIHPMICAEFLDVVRIGNPVPLGIITRPGAGGGMRSVLISIQPKWCELIASGKKTIEVRKNKPKLQTPFKCYIYCTQEKRLLHKFNKGERIDDEHFFDEHVFVRQNTWIRGHFNPNGKVIGEFVCDDIGEFKVFENGSVQYWNYHNLGSTCLTYDEIANYIGRNKDGFSWHISNLVIYDKPKELSEFWSADKCPYESKNGCTYQYHCYRAGQAKRCGGTLERPPQSWCYVEGEGE